MFHRIKGQENIIKSLLQMVQQDRVPHAMLFSSLPGGVALPLAYSLVTYLHCQRRTATDACGDCASCQKANKLIHPDIHHVFPLHGQSSKGKTEGKRAESFAQWRDFVQEKPYGDLADWQSHVGEEARQSTITKAQVHYLHGVLSKKSVESPCKTILIWLPERLHPAAANAMLKMIEEPAPNTYFLLVSFDVHHILHTLHSRLWPIPMRPCDDESLRKLLQEHHPKADAAQIAEVVQMAAGNINLALKTMADPVQGYFAMFSQWMRNLYKRQFDATLQTAETFHAYAPQTQKSWIYYALQMLRYVLLQSFRDLRYVQITDEEANFCQNFGRTVSQGMVVDIIEQLNAMHLMLQRNANARLAFMNLSISIASRFAKKTVAQTKTI